MEQMSGNRALSKVFHLAGSFVQRFNCSNFEYDRFESGIANRLQWISDSLWRKARRLQFHGFDCAQAVEDEGKSKANRLRQLSRWRMRTINQMMNANKPPGMVTSISQPNTPRV
jgi:hypothetical protein